MTGPRGMRAAVATALLPLMGMLVVACDEDAGDPSDGAGSDHAGSVVPFDPHDPTWTIGDTLHTPDASYDLGVEVLAYVRTTAGIVFVAGEGDEHVYSYTGDGEPERIGETSFGGVMLVSDPQSPYVGWLQAFGGDAKVVVYDQRRGRRVLTAPGDLVAIDGKDVYLRHTFASIHVRRVGERGARPVHSRVVAAEGGVRAFNTDDGMVVGTSLKDGIPVDAADDPTTAVFSPGARWVSTGEGGLEVFDVETGETLALEQDAFPFAGGHEWLDEDTLLATAIADDFSSLGLLRCEVVDGTCSVVTEAGIDFENGPLVAFADGRSLWATWN